MQRLYPKPGFKSIGQESINRFAERIFGWSSIYNPSSKRYSTCSLEQYYLDTGFQVTGPCELRYAWKYNDVKPRIYYSMGSSAYFASRYLSKPFYQLMETTKCTNPRSRYSFHRFPLLHVNAIQFLIYDYTSFTSLLSNFSSFIEHLSLFCQDHKVTIFDTHHGFMDIRLQDLLQQYQLCNGGFGEFDISRFSKELGTSDIQVIVPHETAGMLGVYGNITGSTTLHGCVGIQISADEDMFNAIGDDAGLAWDSSLVPLEEVKTAIRVLGEIADEKFIVWTESEEDPSFPIKSWHYTKRPITVIDGVIDQGWMPDFPIIASVTGMSDQLHTPAVKDIPERRRLLIKQTCRLFDSMRLHLAYFDIYDCDIVLDLLKVLYRRLSLPYSGSFPYRYATIKRGSSYPDNFLCVPSLELDSIREGWFKTLKKQRRDLEIFTLPVFELERSRDTVEELFPGFEYIGVGSEMSGLMVKLGIFESTALYEDRLLTDSAIDYYDFCVSNNVKRLYSFRVVKDYHLFSQIVDML
jgi:hypothetical protein